jgi:crotonobetainyl-CoA:carnitine CoA-transferase CaiB-like acyl-CoA transferase
MSEGALAGITVIDLSRVLGGPYCTQILGDHGADVLKVEPPQGDETRGWGPPFTGDTAAYFTAINRNKRGIVLDLKQADAREALLGLLEGADVLVENFKPGTLEGWGLSVGYLAERFPRLVHCRVSGFGADGPLGGLPGYDAAIQAVTGLMSVNGDADGVPTRLGVPVVDMVSGLNAAIGVLLALQERERSGKGQFVDIALFDCGISVLHPHSANFLASRKIPGRSGNAHPNIAPYDSFPTAQGEIFLAVGNDGQFAKLCAQLGAARLAEDPLYASNRLRSENRVALKAELTVLLADREAAPLAEQLIQNGVPCGAVLTVAEALAHPHTRHRGLLYEQGDYSAVGAPVKLSRTPASLRRLPPRFGEHDQEVLGR